MRPLRPTDGLARRSSLANVCFRGKSVHRADLIAMSAYDPKRTFGGLYLSTLIHPSSG
jgi:hypothetical protein